MPLVAVQAVGLACGLASVRWSSALVPPDVLGAYALLVSTQLFGASVTHQGFVQHAQRHWTTQTPAASYLKTLRAAMTRPMLWLGIGLAAVLAYFNLAGDIALGAAWWPWMVAVNVLVVGGHVAHAALQAEQRYWAHFVVSTICAATRSFLPLLFVLAGEVTLTRLGAGFFLHALLWLAAGAWALRAAWHRRPADEAAAIESPQQMVNAFVGVGLCGWLAAGAVRWLAPLALDAQATGFFMLAANLSAIVPSAVSLIGVGYTFPPLFAASRAGASTAELRRMTERAVVLALVVGQAGLLVLAWSAPWLVGIVVDARYAPSMDWLLATGGGLLATVTLSFYCNLLLARERQAACFRLALISGGFRVAAIAGVALAGTEAFRIGLAVLAWPTAVLEAVCVRRWLREETRRTENR